MRKILNPPRRRADGDLALAPLVVIMPINSNIKPSPLPIWVAIRPIRINTNKTPPLPLSVLTIVPILLNTDPTAHPLPIFPFRASGTRTRRSVIAATLHIHRSRSNRRTHPALKLYPNALTLTPMAIIMIGNHTRRPWPQPATLMITTSPASIIKRIPDHTITQQNRAVTMTPGGRIIDTRSSISL